MRKIINILFICILSIQGFAKTKEKPVITMVRGGCFGTCPVFELRFYKSGKIEFDGKLYVAKIGLARKKVSKATIKKLITAFNDAHFGDLNDEYTSPATDGPTITVSFYDGKKVKKVKDYIEGPENLKRLEELLMNMVEQQGWLLKAS